MGVTGGTKSRPTVPAGGTAPSSSADDVSSPSLLGSCLSYADPDRTSDYNDFPDAPDVMPPSVPFPKQTPSFEEFGNCVRRARNGSAPGPNGIPYVVWKYCPSLKRRLYTICQKVWSTGKTPSSWSQAVIVLFHKSGTTSDPTNFRPIALSNCDGKLFFSLLSKSFTSYMIRNEYFDKQTQKGFLPGISGCVEHACISQEALRDARRHRRSICFAWVDLRNAFGSVRHMLVQHCLRRYHFPSHVCKLILNYYERLLAKVSINGGMTHTFHFAVGVFQGCVLSPALFNICFQPLLDALHHKAQTNGWSYTLKSNPSVQRDTSAYADDLEICSWSAASCQAQLDLTDGYLLWSRSMRARPDKCFATSVVLGSDGRYGRTDPALTIGGGRMTYLDDADFRYLGKPINTESSEVDCRRLIEEKLRSLLEALDTDTLTASAKIWLYHHLVASKLSWSLLINDLCLTFVKKLQAIATKSLKRWVGLPKCANPSILFVGGRDQCGLKVRNLITLWKQQQHIKLSLLESSSDERCRLIAEALARRQSEWTRKFAPAREAQIAKTVVISNSAQTTAFDPAAPSVDRPPPSPRTIRKRVNQYIHDIDVAEQLDHLRTLQLQGRWLDWSRHMHQDLSWQRLIHNWSDAELRFALQATTDTAPTATNLRRWGVSEDDPACIMCGKPATLRHVLNGCPVALHQGRYTWRHNSVLSAIRHRLNTFWEQRSTQLAVQATVSTREKARYIQFVRAGQRLPAPNRITQRKPLASQAILLQANDWTFLYDLEGQLQFPIEAAVTSLRPDVVLFSRSSKTIVLLELTVPLEDNVHLAHDRKTTKYSALVTACEENGFKTHMFALEVGCLGYCPHSFLHCFEALGLPKSAARQIRSEASKTALRSSYVLFLRRGMPTWECQAVLC